MKVNFISELLELKQNSVVLVNGSGGKTTFCKTLSLELFQKNFLNKNVSILFSTTTKIKNFEDNNYKKILYESENLKNNINLLKNLNGLYLIAMKYQEKNKLSSLPLDLLENLTYNFTYSILEADGSRRKMIKAWNENEPVYLNNTTHSVGIIPIKSLNLEINEQNIHRLEIFQKNFNFINKTKIDINLLEEIILNSNGLFKNALGEKILFINQVETQNDIKFAKKLAENIKKTKLISKIILGSLYKKNYILI